jgi:hypothetical protein
MEIISSDMIKLMHELMGLLYKSTQFLLFCSNWNVILDGMKTAYIGIVYEKWLNKTNYQTSFGNFFSDLHYRTLVFPIILSKT